MNTRLWVTTPEHLEASMASLAIGPFQRWRCPCGESTCEAVVVYARASQRSPEIPRFCFMATVTFQEKPPFPTLMIENVEDFHDLLADDILDGRDRTMYAIWLDRGLREAILNAPEHGETP